MFFFRKILPIFVTACLAAGSILGQNPLPASERLVLREGEVQFRTRVRMIAAAERTLSIVNPLSHPQIEWIVPDGSLVSSGQVVTVFEPKEYRARLRDRQLEGEALKADLRRDTAAQGDQDLSRRDALAELVDQKAVLETKLARLKALPDPDSVRIAEGQLRVASIEADAAARDMAKAQDRFGRELIARAELDAFSFTLEEKDAARDRAAQLLEYRKLPAASSTIRETELLIANVDLDIARKRDEIEENAAILKIKQRGMAARRDMVAERIREAEADVANLEVTSPGDGHVIYTRNFRETQLESGGKMWKRSPFMQLPDIATLVLRGSVRESERQFLEVGDEAVAWSYLHTNDSYGAAQSVTGRIASIGMLSRDQGDKAEQDWGGSAETGVKVYDVTVVVDPIPHWLRVGVHADVTLHASRKTAGIVVPAGFVALRDGAYYVAFDGVLEKVEGTMVGDQLVLKDISLAGRTITLFGRERALADQTPRRPEGVHVSGELVPVDTQPVRVGRIYRWQKLAWVIPEDTEVAVGDVVARLDATDTGEELAEMRSRLQQAESTRSSQEKQDQLQQRMDELQLEKERNLTDIQLLRWQSVKDGRNWPGLFGASYSVRRAEIGLARLEREYARSADKGHRLLSPLAKGRLERDLERARLELEAATIELTQLREGPKEIEWRREEMRYLDARRDVEDMAQQMAFDQFKRERMLSRARQREARVRRGVEELLTNKENLQVKSPAAGVIRYGRVWNGGIFSKVEEGAVVGTRFTLMDVAQVADMEVRVGVPERYFCKVTPGMQVAVTLPSVAGVVLDGVVTNVEFLFEGKRRKDTEAGIYSSQENLGETEFFVRVKVHAREGVELKPGTMAEITFPFNGGAE